MNREQWLAAMAEQRQKRAQLEQFRDILTLEEYGERILAPAAATLRRTQYQQTCLDHWNYIWTRHFEHLGEPNMDSSPAHNIVNGVCTRCNSAHPEEHELCAPHRSGESRLAPEPSRRILAADDFDVIGARLAELRAARAESIDTTPAEEP